MFGVRCFFKALLLAQLGYIALVPAAAQTQINNLGSARPNATAPQKSTSATPAQEVDAIVAVVNKDVITRRARYACSANQGRPRAPTRAASTR